MPARLKAFFVLPRFADEEQTRLAALLFTIQTVLLVAALSGLAAGLFFGRVQLAAPIALALLIVLAGMALTRRGYVSLAAMIITSVMLVSITYIAYSGYGIHAHVILAYAFVIVISSFILSRILFIFNTALCILAVALLTFGEMYGFITTPFTLETSLYDFVVVSLILVITAVLTRHAADQLQHSLVRARENEIALVAANQQMLLQKQIVQQREAETSQFLQKLQSLYEVSLELGRVKSLPDLYHQAVELGRSRLGFDRLGVLLYDPLTREMVGTYGTDADGRTVDESSFRNLASPHILEMLEARTRVVVRESVPLHFSGKAVGFGWNALSILWDGDKGIGWLSADNLTSGKPLLPSDLEILTLYAAALGNLITRVNAAQALQASELEARHFQEKLQALHEVGMALAATESLTEMYRQTIELGRERLGFDRLGLFLYDDENDMMLGTFGTDAHGRLRDERHFKLKTDRPEILEILHSQQRLGLWENTILRDGGKQIGIGWNAMSVLWDGKRGIGWLASDNLLTQEPATPFQLEMLTLYGGLLGHLVALKRREETLNNYAHELERSNKELEQFAYAASHDLQEPLRKVQTFGDRLAANYADVLEPRGLDYLARMQDATARMQQLIQDLLALSRVSTRAQPFVEVDLTAVLHKVLSDLETRIEEKNATISVLTLPTVQGDPTQMRQLLQNLVGNALKFSRPDVPPHIVVGSQPLSHDDGEFLTIFVKDNGIGFDEKYVDRIFSPFQRLHGRNHFEGSGIGLAICKRIVERHNGRITVHSHSGEGSAFYVSLPKIQLK